MPPFFPCLLMLMIAVPGAALAQDCAPSGTTDVTVSKAGSGAVATFRFAQAIDCIRFADRGDVRKLTWQLESPGATLSADGDVVSFKSASRQLKVRLGAFERDGQIDRVYSPLIAFGDGTAVAVFTGYLTPADSRHGLFFRFHGFAPPASEQPVGWQRVPYGVTYMVVGKPGVQRRGKVALVIDRTTPPWLLRSVTHAIEQGEAALRGVDLAVAPLTYLVTHTEPHARHANWRGDTLDKLVRLNFMGSQWSANPETDALIASFTLHEMFHTVSSPVLDPQAPGAMSLSEGGAEAAAMVLSERLGKVTAAALQFNVDSAIARCQAIDGRTLADKEKRNQRNAPYQCGAALQFLAAKASDAGAPNALGPWKALTTAPTTRGSAWPAFFTAAESSPTASKPALDILRKMALSQLDWNGGMQQLHAGGVVRKRSEADLAGTNYSPMFRGAVIKALLAAHCRQGYGYYDEAPVYRLDAPEGSCGAIPDRFRLAALNGVRLQEDGYRAHALAAQRCSAGLPNELEDDQGRKFALPCKAPLAELPVYTIF